MVEILNSEEMKQFERNEFLKKSSFFFMKKAGGEVVKFIDQNLIVISRNYAQK